MTISGAVHQALTADPTLSAVEVRARVIAAGATNRYGDPPTGGYIRRLVRNWRAARPELVRQVTGPITMAEISEHARRALYRARREGSPGQEAGAVRLLLDVWAADPARAGVDQSDQASSVIDLATRKAYQD